MSSHPHVSFLRDVAFSLRLVRRHPVETTLAVAALALGVGLSTALFAILWGTVLRGLPFENAERLVRVESISQGERLTPTDADFLAWRQRQTSFAGIAAWLGSSFNLSGQGITAERCNGAFVSANIFRLIQAHPRLGRDFNSDDEAPGAPRVAILSAELWRSQLNSDPNVLGRAIKLNGVEAQVVGVMPEGIGFPLRQEIWVPLQLSSVSDPKAMPFRIQILGQLKESIPPRQAAAELQALLPETHSGQGVRLTPFVDAYTEDLQPALRLLLGASLGLLLVVCATISGLLTAQTQARLPELGVRSAVGATRTRLLLQLFNETVVLSILGAVLGLPLAAAATRVYLASQGGDLPSFWMDVRLDPPVIAYGVALAFLVSFLSALLPALQVTGHRLNEVLKAGAGKAILPPPGPLKGFRLAVQIALSVVLLVATSLLIASLRKVGRLEVGSSPESVLTAQILVPYTYSDSSDRLRFFDALERRLEGVLGSGNVAFASALPGGAADEAQVEIEGQPQLSGHQLPTVPYLIVSRSYFPLLRVSPVEGRNFDITDHAEGTPVVVVNRSFVVRYLGTRPPPGVRFRFVSSDGPGPWRTIVGVVPDLVMGEPRAAHREGAYVLLDQAPASWMAVLLRASGDPRSLTSLLRRSVAETDSEIPVFRIATLQERVEATRQSLATIAGVFLIFGAIALFLSLLGIYGITAHAVAGRSREIGIRLALGAKYPGIMLLLFSKIFLQILAGILLGIFLSLITSQLLEFTLFGMQARNLGILASVAVFTLLAGGLAFLLPLAAILKIQPAQTLRLD
jgi:putative ABC transport system permease protein